MSKVSKWLTLFLLLAAMIFPPAAAAQDIVVSEIRQLKLAGNDVVEIEPNAPKGFNFPCFLFVPDKADRGRELYMLVETNNTGTASDDFDVHRQKALDLVSRSYPNRIARDLCVPLLVPVFPRPATNWQAYTHALDRDTLEINEGKLKRIDLQLIAMIDHALELLRANGFKMHDKVFMHGFSASAKFCNHFAFLYPERVKAVASGGVNGIPTLPISTRNGYTLPFPIGIADIETFTGRPFDEQAHRQIPQYIYMGYMDRNDTLPSRDAWNENEAKIIREAIAEKIMPDRWQITQTIYREKLPCAQCVTYNGVGHAIKDEMRDDLVKFFKANSGESFVAIEPHVYPFIEYRQIREAHVNAVYCKGDKRLPEFVGKGLQEGTYLIGIKEWMQGQDYRQLDEFVENAGFNFRLQAEGHPEIVITESNYRGNSSMGDGEFQAFYVEFDEEQLKKLAPGLPYTLHPENKSDKYVWIVNEGVTLVRPMRYDEMILAGLDSAILPRIELNADIRGAVKILEKITENIVLEGTEKKIHFELRAESGEITRMPNIHFSADGLSTMELLLIICHRAKMDYRIEETTVYIESKK
jgi:hypothetical protein